MILLNLLIHNYLDPFNLISCELREVGKIKLSFLAQGSLTADMVTKASLKQPERWVPCG
jgi:hypothetical protein